MRISLLAGIILSTSIFNFAQSPDWINFFHAPGNVPETIENVTFDNSGNIYMSGYGYFVSGGQGDDFLTIKINSSGTELWQNVFNGAQNSTERPYGMFVDDDGNVYVTGTSRWNSNAYKIVTLKYSAGG
ncbi:MAG: SBBP repeat-containing protein, partial [Ignavibacteriaceae bacterium]|nr:SBBP repeat-containing protein [Ignavibacteriaceae bacterium]